MSTIKNTHAYFSGHFHFSNKVTIDELILIAEEFAQDKLYIKILIQGAGNDGEYRLCFTCNPEISEDKVPFDYITDFSEKTTDMLKRKLGNGLKGHSISNRYFSIK